MAVAAAVETFLLGTAVGGGAGNGESGSGVGKTTVGNSSTSVEPYTGLWKGNSSSMNLTSLEMKNLLFSKS